MRLVLDSLDGSVPRRGDILQTNVGARRERTCLILRVHRARSGRFHVWCERWWQMEPDFRMRLYRSAQRAGGQQVICFHRYPPKKKKRNPFYEDIEKHLPQRARPRRARQHLPANPRNV